MQIEMRNAAGSSATTHRGVPASQPDDRLRRSEIYAWIEETLIRQEYFAQGKKQRGAENHQ